MLLKSAAKNFHRQASTLWLSHKNGPWRFLCFLDTFNSLKFHILSEYLYPHVYDVRIQLSMNTCMSSCPFPIFFHDQKIQQTRHLRSKSEIQNGNRVENIHWIIGYVIPEIQTFPCGRFSDLVPLISGLGVAPSELYRGRDDFLAIFDDEDTIASLSPDMTLISKVPSRGVIVSSLGHEVQVDFVSRFFAPQSDVTEDPVTGSAHTTLILYWSKRLAKQHLRAKQISKRGGDLVCRNLGQRVEIGGQAATYLVREISL